MVIKNKNNKLFYTLLCIVLFICFISFAFGDLVYTSGQSYNLLDLIFKLDKTKYVFESPFYIPVHLIFAIWNLPFWIVSCFNSNVVFDSSLSVLWAKLLPVLAFLISAVYLKKILIEINIGLEEISNYLSFYLTSLFALLPIFVMAQYDIIGMCFFLIALYYSLKEDHLSLKAILLLSFSVSFKLLSGFAVISILLLKSKDIKDLIKNLLILSIFPLLFIGISYFLLNIVKIENIGNMTSRFVTGLLYSQIGGGNYNISVVFVLLMLVYSYLFIMDKNYEKRKYIQTLSWSNVIIYFSLMFFARPFHPQWYVIPNIFILLLISSNEKTFKELHLFLEIIEVLLTFCNVVYFNWVFLNENIFNNLLFKELNSHFITVGNHTNFAETLSVYINKDMAAIIAWSIAFACAVLVVVKLNPSHKTIERKDNTPIIQFETLNWIRLVGMFAYALFEYSFRFFI